LAKLLRRRDVQVWMALVVLSGIGAVAWILMAHTLNQLPGAPLPAGTSTSHLVRVVVGQTSGFFYQYIGTFGAFDVNAPQVAIAAWVGACAVLVTLGVALSKRKMSVCLAWAALLTLVIPVVLGVAEARSDGLIGQGRYYLPIAVGVPLIAGAGRGAQRVLGSQVRRVVGVLAVLVAVGQIAAFSWALRRFLVGSAGPLNPLAHVPGGWLPPVNPLVLDVLAVVGALLYGAWLVGLADPVPVAAPPAAGAASESGLSVAVGPAARWDPWSDGDL
jgi:hypothetical protein